MSAEASRKRKTSGTGGSEPDKCIPVPVDLDKSNIDFDLLAAESLHADQIFRCILKLVTTRENDQTVYLLSGILMKAERQRNESINIQELLNRPADNHNNTLLHLAAAHGSYRICKVLLEYKANPYAKNRAGEVAMRWDEVEHSEHPGAYSNGEDDDDEYFPYSEELDGFDSDFDEDFDDLTEEMQMGGKRRPSLLSTDPLPRKSARLESFSGSAAPAVTRANGATKKIHTIVASSLVVISPPSPDRSHPQLGALSLDFLSRPSHIGAAPRCLDNTDLSLPPSERFPTGQLQKELENAIRLIVFVCELRRVDCEPITVNDADRMMCLACSADLRLIDLCREHMRTAPSNPAFVEEHALVFRMRALALARHCQTL